LYIRHCKTKRIAKDSLSGNIRLRIANVTSFTIDDYEKQDKKSDKKSAKKSAMVIRRQIINSATNPPP